MELINNKILLSDLAAELGVTNSAILQHLHNPKTGLGEGAEKFGHKITGGWLLPIGSVLQYLSWAKTKGRKVSQEKLFELEDKLCQVKR
jgi:hypothetical protein